MQKESYSTKSILILVAVAVVDNFNF